jgi:TolB-like protein
MSGISEEQKQAVEQQLERIVSSATFSGSERHRKFLTFVVEQALKGDTDRLNEFVLGFEVFNKNESFDPRIDSIVRVEARRLRERLRKYYDEEGVGDPIVITLRPRSFIPEFHDKTAPPSETPAAPQRHPRRTIVLVLAAVLFGAAVTAAVFLLSSRRASPPPTAAIAILPFEVVQPQPGQAVLGEAIADALITGLAGSPGLRVISRGSGAQFQESGKSSLAVAKDLKLDYIVEGSVQPTGSGVRVTVKITDVHTEAYVWADTRECKLEALDQLERDFTAAISSRIRIPLAAGGGAQVVRRRPSNWRAYAVFLKGQYYWYQQEPGAVKKSIELLEQATREDPGYAPAWAWLAMAYQLEIMRDDGRDASLIAQGRQAAQKALELDDQLAESHAAAGSYAALDWDWPRAEREFTLAISQNPDWAQGHLMYALLYLMPNGQTRAAVGEMLHAHELDPLTRITRSMVAEAFYFAGDYGMAINEFSDLRKPGVAPSPGDAHYFLALSLSGKPAQALAEFQQSGSSFAEDSPAAGLAGYLLAINGKRQEAAGILERLKKKAATGGIPPVSIALVAVGLGDHREALQQLKLAADRHSPSICQALIDPVFTPLRSDPKFAEIVRTVGVNLRW